MEFDKKEDKDIFHSCKCIGQNFTFGEWGKYLKQTDNHKIVHQYKEFGFNIYDVCLTPNVKIKYADKTNFFEVKTAQSDNGRWTFGFHYDFLTRGGCKAAAYVDKLNDGYNTEKDAIYAALNSLEESCQRVIEEIERYGKIIDNEDNPHGISHLPKLKAVKNKIEIYKEQYNPMSLYLFGW